MITEKQANEIVNSMVDAFEKLPEGQYTNVFSLLTKAIYGKKQLFEESCDDYGCFYQQFHKERKRRKIKTKFKRGSSQETGLPQHVVYFARSIPKSKTKRLPHEEIVIESYSGFFSHPQYEDVLKITPNSISYDKKIQNPDTDLIIFRGEEQNAKWSYKTTNNTFKETFYEIVNELDNFADVIDTGDVFDASGFAITLKYRNGVRKVIKRWCDVYLYEQDVTLQEIADKIIGLIPKDESIPTYLVKEEYEED